MNSGKEAHRQRKAQTFVCRNNGWAPTNSQAKYFSGGTENVQLCLANDVGHIFKRGIPDMHKERAKQGESLCIPDCHLHHKRNRLGNNVLFTKQAGKYNQGICKNEHSSPCLWHCDCRA